MDVTIVARASHQRNCAEAVASGLRRHGRTVHIQESTSCTTKTVACWGWRKGKVLRDAGHEVLVMERAYLGDRYQWYSLGWNGLNGRADFRGVRDDGGARFREHFGHLMQPWRETPGKYVLLVGQVPGDASLQGRDLSSWYTVSAVTARAAYNMPVLFREHPEARKRGINRNPAYTNPSKAETLAQALADAHVVITFNSNTAVESVLAGIPTVTADEGSMARSVTAHQTSMRVAPDRERWAAQLAWKQWTLTEIARGVPFET